MLILRSLVYNVVFYLNLAFWLLVTIPTYPFAPHVMVAVARQWGRTSIWLMRVICGTHVEIKGLENIPPGGIIFAGKHQSAWETFALLTIIQRPVFILKRELTWIPFFGWCLIKTRMIPVDRGSRTKVLHRAAERAKVEVCENGRQLIIFPEGTRRAPGAEPAYKFGVAYMYGELGVPCVPMALNAGLFWPRRRFIRRPGTIRMEILEAIPPGLDRLVFNTLLQERIEEASNRLLALGQADLRERGL
jgi:1-acyl-sn-glycerol-3-phosphate acyltransferase